MKAGYLSLSIFKPVIVMRPDIKPSNDIQANWSLGPLPRSLALNEVHLWRANQDLSSHTIDRYHQILSLDEQKRARRYHFERDRIRFVFRRGLLRKILGIYTNTAPGEFVFNCAKYGKPELDAGAGMERIHFNSSSSNGLVLLAFSRGLELGVDVERVREIPEMEEISRRFFTQAESRALSVFPAAERRPAFFSAWTCKEAFLKATGDGLSYPLDKFCVSITPGENSRLLCIEGDLEEAARWSILSFVPEADYIAALAVRSRVHQIKYWKLVEDALN